MITEFQGQYRWLSNFWPAKVMYDKYEFPSSEHAYVAAKVNDPHWYAPIASMTAAMAKRQGKSYQWNSRDKRVIMLNIVRDKFVRNPHLTQLLCDTGDQELQEGNRWHDRYWGVCPPGSNNGRNELGKILMQVRKELQT